LAGTGGWREALSVYADRRVVLILVLGFASGLPLLLVYSTLSAWLSLEHVDRTAVGLFALVQLPYLYKFLWAPLLDHVPPPLPIGQRRGWGICIQLLLVASIVAMGTLSPTRSLFAMAVLATIVAFLSASQDVVIDAYRVELLGQDQQGAGGAVIQAGYRIAMLVSGAGALIIADRFGWFAAYATMGVLLSLGIVAFLVAPEPAHPATPRRVGWLDETVVAPFRDFMDRHGWAAILIFVVGYKLGEAMAGAMATPLYIDLGFTPKEIGYVSKGFGFAATLIGVFAGGSVVARMGAVRALLLCGLLQSAGNLFYILQAAAGHDLRVLALCVAAENLTGGMAGTALIAYLSGLCRQPFTATQYALLASLAASGRVLFASSGGALSKAMGWEGFFLGTTLVTLPALILLLWMHRRGAGGRPTLR
jgi:PAT family beta-lactamase induction signal transducer AmpG